MMYVFLNLINPIEKSLYIKKQEFGQMGTVNQLLKSELRL